MTVPLLQATGLTKAYPGVRVHHQDPVSAGMGDSGVARRSATAVLLRRYDAHGGPRLPSACLHKRQQVVIAAAIIIDDHFDRFRRLALRQSLQQ